MDIDLTGCPDKCGRLTIQLDEPFNTFSFTGSPREVDGDFIVRDMWADVNDMTGGPDRITGSFYWYAKANIPGRLKSLLGCPFEIMGNMSVVNSPCARFPLNAGHKVKIGGLLNAGYLSQDTIPDMIKKRGYTVLSDGAVLEMTTGGKSA